MKYSDAKKTHAVGGTLFVDSTFGPPPLQVRSSNPPGDGGKLINQTSQDPFAWGADCVMHSGTKYFGGEARISPVVPGLESNAVHRPL